MAEINPAEISAILKKQLSGFESGATLEEVGTVLQVGDGIARVYGLSNAQYGELVQFENGLEAIVLNLEEDNVGVVLLGPSTGIREGSIVKRTQRIASLKVGEQIVGRVVDTLGNPIRCVLFTVEPSLIPVDGPKSTTPTLSSSKFKTIASNPLSNCTNSPY